MAEAAGEERRRRKCRGGGAPGRVRAMAADPDSAAKDDLGPRMLDPHDPYVYPLATPADRRFDERALAEHAFHLLGTDFVPHSLTTFTKKRSPSIRPGGH